MATDVVSHFEIGLDASMGTTSHVDAGDQVSAVRERPLAYCLLAVLLPLLAIPGFILLGQSDYFMHHGASVWVQSNDAVFQMKNRKCDVLIFGDSTAMTGIDPSLVEKDTGLKTCNIAVTNAVLNVTGNLTLDKYLQQNGRPRVLLMQLSPDGFQQESRSWHSSIYAEGMLEMMRHGTFAQRRDMLLQHPHEAVSFSGYAAGFAAYSAIKEGFYAATGMRPDEDSVTVRNGFFTPPVPARTQCEAVGSAQDSASGDFPRRMVQQFIRDYAPHSNVVLVNVAPIPACDQNLSRFQKTLAGVTSNQLTALPIGYFNDGRHYTASGSEVVSRLISEEINQTTGPSGDIAQRRMGSDAMATLRGPASATISR